MQVSKQLSPLVKMAENRSSKISTFRYIQSITKTCLYNFDPLNPTLYSKTGGLQGYTLFFLFLHKNIDRGYTLELPRWGGSNEYPQSMFRAEIWKMSEFFIWNFQFFVVKYLVYLNRIGRRLFHENAIPYFIGKISNAKVVKVVYWYFCFSRSRLNKQGRA